MDLIASHTPDRDSAAAGTAAEDAQTTLRALVADPRSVDLASVDALTRALLMTRAWERLRLRTLDELSAEQLRDSAQHALDGGWTARRTAQQRASVAMTLALLAAAASWHAARRRRLVRDALGLVFRLDYVQSTAVLRQAHAARRL